MSTDILVSGGTGFIGGALLKRLVNRADWRVAALVRHVDAALPAGVAAVALSPDQPFAPTAYAGKVDVVVHCAARVHVMREEAGDPLAEFRRVNVEGTLNLARYAIQAGAKRFVFLSSIKVNGESTAPGQPFRADDVAAPVDPYAVSKLEAEQQLRALAEQSGLQVVIIRMPLVYGPGVKANFHALMRCLQVGIPLPFGAVANKRSLVALDNLVDLILICIEHPAAANQTFLAADGEDLSVAELARRLAGALHRPARLLPVPAALLRLGACALGRRAIYQRLCGSLQVDIGKTREVLGWHPPVGVDEGLRRAAEGFLERSR